MCRDQEANSNHTHLLQEQLDHVCSLRAFRLVQRIREENYFPGGQSDAQERRPLNIAGLYDHEAEQDHAHLLQMVDERKEDKVLLQSLPARTEVIPAEKRLADDIVAAVEVQLGRPRLSQPDKAIYQKSAGKEETASLEALLLIIHSHGL